MIDLVWLIPAFPLAGFLVILLFGRRLGEPGAGYVGTAAIFASFIASIAVYFDLQSNEAGTRAGVSTLFSWVPVGSLQVDMALLADPLTITMCMFITGISSMILLYSVGYMHGDPKFSKFFLYLCLFVLSMTVLVLGENLLVTFLGWEGVGTCSYFLIAFWHTRESAATAGKKAFVTNRVGDWGVMLAMFLCFSAVGSLSYSVLNNNAESGLLAESTATGIVMLLFVGAIGKSAQLPLYIWLPDAMEGPTPVSALIHAATMVTAGVFLMIRINPVIAASYDWVNPVIAWTGAITALFAATIALAQNDIKKVLAYSTVSQLGFMFLAIGTGAYVAAIFHVITHALFKALLFLGSGSVIHAMNDEQDMRKMGKLAKFMPLTASTFIVGWLAIAGVPPFGGFWSKDEILLFVLADGSEGLYIIALVTAVLTAYYMTRQVIMTFYGEQKWESKSDEHGAHGDFKPHESPPIMTIPLVVLAVGTIVIGLIQLPVLAVIPDSVEHRLADWLHAATPAEADIAGSWADDHKLILIAIATAAAFVGIAAGWLVYQRKRFRAIEPVILADGWYYDRTITNFMGGPGREGFQAVADFDSTVVDGAVTAVGASAEVSGKGLRRLQTGYVRQYASVIGIGVVALLFWFVLRGVL
ncbi:MAG: NADH-quinone oxidoreductase subunit L [Acidimicrobiia bacterium]|nr:NADH-quinone oxidoreductase subunit L [Acidimicrobiia bacterium]